MVKVGDTVKLRGTLRAFVVESVTASGIEAAGVWTGEKVFIPQGDYEVVKENLTTETEEVKHNHYFVDLSAYIKDGKCVVDVYKILAAYKVVHPELQHLGKKVLCLGQRGLKDALTDAENILDSAESLVERLKLEIAYANKGEQCDGQ